jgi:hypothetical protein
MGPKFAVEGHGWSASFQRRIGTSNRGALPCFVLLSVSDCSRVLVPVRDGEALWVAILGASDIKLDGRAGSYQLRTNIVSQDIGQQTLCMLDAIRLTDASVPIDSASIPRAASRDELETDGLTIHLEREGWTHELSVVLATPMLYESLSGFPLPQPTSEQDAYRGWRLP